MSNTLAQAHEQLPPSDRRLYVRQPIRSLAYVELDEGNGGIVLNISEGGLSVQAVTSLMDDLLPGVRFQLSESEGWIEANARITWTGPSRKVAGLEFVDLPEEAPQPNQKMVRPRKFAGRSRCRARHAFRRRRTANDEYPTQANPRFQPPLPRRRASSQKIEARNMTRWLPPCKLDMPYRPHRFQRRTCQAWLRRARRLRIKLMNPTPNKLFKWPPPRLTSCPGCSATTRL